MEITLTLTGRRPLLMHNQQLADPLNEHTRALARLTGKRAKTEEDHRLVAETELIGGLYINSEGPYVPSTWILGSLIDAGKITKHGTAVKRAVFMLDAEPRLEYTGPRTITGLAKDANHRLTTGVKIGTKRVMRTRAYFDQWSVTVPMALETEVLDLDVFRGIVDRAGRVIGVGDWRPYYGTYTATVTVV